MAVLCDVFETTAQPVEREIRYLYRVTYAVELKMPVSDPEPTG